MNTISNVLDHWSIELVLLPTTIRKRYFQRPKLEIKIEVAYGSYSKAKWLSAKSTEKRELYVYETCWKYKIIITNSSRFPALNPRLHYNRVLPHYSGIDFLNHDVPLKAFSEVCLNGEYIMLEECEENKNTLPTGLPDCLRSIKILLQYQNDEKVNFYTAYDVRQKHNVISFFKPSEFVC